AADPQVARTVELVQRLLGSRSGLTPQEFRKRMQVRMSRYAAHIRMPETIGAVISETRGDLDELNRGNARLNTAHDILTVLQNRQLCLTQLAVLRSIQAFLEAGGGSRGSFLVLDRNGKPIHDQ